MFTSPGLLPHLSPQNLLLALLVWEALEGMLQSLSLVLTPPAFGCQLLLCPMEVLPCETVLGFQLVKPVGQPP